MLAAFPGANELRGFEALHVWHLDVEQDGREIVLKQIAQSVRAGAPQHQVFIQSVERGFDRHQIVWIIVDEQYFDFIARRFFALPSWGRHAGPRSLADLTRRRAHTAAPEETRSGMCSERREIHTRITAKSCSRSTGLVT